MTIRIPAIFVKPLGALALALSLACAAGPLAAAEPARPAPGAAANWAMRAMLDCQPDAKRYCADVQAGGGRIASCLAGARERLAPACAKHFQTAEAIRESFEDCADDVRRYCENVVPGGGRVASCLAGNRDRLSPQCRSGLEKANAALQR